jgi:hypothetical protein
MGADWSWRHMVLARKWNRRGSHLLRDVLNLPNLHLSRREQLVHHRRLLELRRLRIDGGGVGKRKPVLWISIVRRVKKLRRRHVLQRLSIVVMLSLSLRRRNVQLVGGSVQQSRRVGTEKRHQRAADDWRGWRRDLKLCRSGRRGRCSRS